MINPAIASDFLARLLRTSRDAAIARGENEQDPSLPDLPLTAADLLNKLIRPDRAEPDAMTPGASGLGDIRAEARQRIERNLDALHIALNSAWQRRIRVESSLVCGLIALVVVLRTTPGAATTVAFVVAAVIVGGPFSWFARDLVKILERRRA